MGKVCVVEDSSCGVMDKELDCNISKGDFELESLHYVLFRTNIQVWVK